MRIHVRYHPFKYGGKTRCPAMVWSDQYDGRWFIRCVMSRQKGRLFCKRHGLHALALTTKGGTTDE